MMKLSALASLLLLFGGAPRDGMVRTLTVDGVERRAVVFPGRGARTQATPVVFVFHGHGGSARNASRKMAVHREWPEATVAYLDGLPAPGARDPEGQRPGWQKNPGELGDRDLKFFDALLADIRARQKVDESRIYACGFSNGGRFTYLLWATRGHLLAAVAPVASQFLMNDLYKTAKPKPALLIHGRRDRRMPFTAAQQNIQAVAQLNQCDLRKSRMWDQGYTLYEPRPAGADLVVHIHPGAHVWPDGASAHIVRFFKEHTLQAP